MERKYVNLPLPSVVIREYSLILALLYFFAQSQASLVPIMAALSLWGIYRMVRMVTADNGYSTCYKAVATCVLVIALTLIIYGLFFRTQGEQINHLITIVGLCIVCGSLLVAAVVILCLRKRIGAAKKDKDIVQCFFDAAHVLMLYVVVLTNL